jgi:Domain of unknown function (DUF5916)
MLTILGLVAALHAAPDSILYSGRRGELDVALPRIENAQIHVDGKLDEAAWSRAAIMGGFTQYEPVEGIESSEDTEIRVFYAADAIYFGLRAYDRNPEDILARLGERDRAVFNDDWIRIMLDTFDDKRQAYVFYVNPLGLQTDGLWIEGRPSRFGGRGGRGAGVSIDFSPDFIWQSDGRVDDQGWTAEIRIPYVSLRFREVPEQSWGIQVAREVKRRAFKQSWAPLTKNISSTLEQSGHLVGLIDIHPRRLVEVNPVATGIRAGSDESGRFLRSDPEGDFGVNARVGVTRNVVLDATYNPDFSQVEADANRLTINERFALFFPEKRAFFLEGTETFSTPQRLVYTRQIVDPVGGVKLSGKVGSFNVGYIGALDDSPSSLSGGTGRAGFNLVRLRRDIGRGSTVGLLYTDRTMTDDPGVYNRLVAGDARLVFGGRYTLTTQVAGSFDRTATDRVHQGFRPLVSTSFARSGRDMSWSLDFTDIDPRFRARSGFITRAGDTRVNARLSFTKFGKPGATLERTSLSISNESFFDHDEFWGGATPFENRIQVMPTFSFRGGRSVTFILRNGYFRFRPESYASYGVIGEDGDAVAFTTPEPLRNLKAFTVFPRIRINNELNINGRFMARETPIFLEASRGFEFQVGPDIQWRPTSQLQLSLNHTYSKIWRRSSETVQLVQGSSGLATGGATSTSRTETRTVRDPYSTVNVTNLRTQFQFSRALMTRVIIQYELNDRAAAVDPTTGGPLTRYGVPLASRSTGEFQGQFLVQYEPSPGTIFYIGYTRLMEGAKSYRLSSMNPTEEGLFMKISYLFRM